MDVLAIVGSTNWRGAEDGLLQARALIVKILTESRPDKVISGGAVGIDKTAVEIAKSMGIPTQEILPENRR